MVSYLFVDLRFCRGVLLVYVLNVVNDLWVPDWVVSFDCLPDCIGAGAVEVGYFFNKILVIVEIVFTVLSVVVLHVFRDAFLPIL